MLRHPPRQWLADRADDGAAARQRPRGESLRAQRRLPGICSIWRDRALRHSSTASKQADHSPVNSMREPVRSPRDGTVIRSIDFIQFLYE